MEATPREGISLGLKISMMTGDPPAFCTTLYLKGKELAFATRVQKVVKAFLPKAANTLLCTVRKLAPNSLLYYSCFMSGSPVNREHNKLKMKL
jgi:hypothetical protein